MMNDLSSCAIAAQQQDTRIAVRTELHQIRTVTLSDRDFLRGNECGVPVTIAGQFRLAHGKGRLPVVMLQHGSGGFGGNIDYWSRELNQAGISTFALDSFTGRGLIEVNSNQATLGRLNFILDDYRALDILGSHRCVDSSRIALMGFSRGGQAALYAALKRFHALWNQSRSQFAGYIAFYPDCMTTYACDSEVVHRPIRVFAGTQDDYNPVFACKSYVERLRVAGADIALTEYRAAPHAFDNPLGSFPPTLFSECESLRNCIVREEEDGVLTNAHTKRPFTYQDSCVARGVHLGYDRTAAQSSRDCVIAFLRKIFELA